MINKKITATIISILIALSALLSSCGSAPKQSQMQTQQDTSSKSMEQLTGIENNIEKIIKTLNGPAVESDEKQGGGQGGGQGSQNKQQNTQQQSTQQQSTQQQSTQQGTQGGGSQGGSQGGEQGGGQGGGQGTQNQSTQQQPSKPQETKTQDPWQGILGTINSMHYQWNGYMPEALKLGAGKTIVDGFETALNDLTLAVMNKNSNNTIMAANHLYSFIPDFNALHKSSISPEIKRIRYYIRDSILNSLADNFTQADTDISSMKSSWSMMKISLSKEMQSDGSKLDFSIYELEKVVKEKNKALVDIKGRVALSNVVSLEKAMKKAQQQQQQKSAKK